MARYIEFAEFDEKTCKYNELLGHTFMPDQRYKEDTIVRKMRNREDYSIPPYATHIRFLYGSSLLSITGHSHYYSI